MSSIPFRRRTVRRGVILRGGNSKARGTSRAGTARVSCAANVLPILFRRLGVLPEVIAWAGCGRVACLKLKLSSLPKIRLIFSHLRVMSDHVQQQEHAGLRSSTHQRSSTRSSTITSPPSQKRKGPAPGGAGAMAGAEKRRKKVSSNAFFVVINTAQLCSISNSVTQF